MTAKLKDSPLLQERYVAAMVLSGVGDAMGYKNGDWEFCHSGRAIHEELEELGGVDKLHVKLPDWMVSDDTVMHVATAEALVTKIPFSSEDEKIELYCCMADKYKLCMREMTGRAPGATCMNGCHQLKPARKIYTAKFNPRGGGCGGAMRSMCIGLRFPKPEQIDDLIAVSVEAGRMTHNHPTGFLGSLASALFTSYAIQGKELRTWGHGLMEISKKAMEYVKMRKVDVEENTKAWDYFEDHWNDYLLYRNLISGDTDPVFPEQYGIEERDAFYKSLSFAGWAGSSGHDAPMIAYDALLSSEGDWRELCSRSMFHSGDSDSTGVIAACCYGAMYGFNGVEPCNYKNLESEYRKRLTHTAEQLYSITLLDESADNLRDENVEDTGEPDIKKISQNLKDDKMDPSLDLALPSPPSNDDLVGDNDLARHDELAGDNAPEKATTSEDRATTKSLEKKLEDLTEK